MRTFVNKLFSSRFPEAVPDFSDTRAPDDSNQKQTFLSYIHSFRGLAMLFIVGLHTCITSSWDDALFQRKSVVVLFNNGVVLFVFIAGYLFYHLHKDNFHYGEYLRKKFSYVIVPYLLVSVPALIDKIYLSGIGDSALVHQNFADWPVLVRVLYLLFTGKHMGIFWLIPMISVLYALAPVFVVTARHKSFIFLAPVVVILGLYTIRLGYFAGIILSLQYCLPVYVFGIWMHKMQDHVFADIKTWIIALGTAFLVLTMSEFLELVPFNETISLREVQYTIYRFNWNKLKMHILAVFALLVFYHWSNIRSGFLDLIGDYSLGIFFVHLYVLQGFRMLDRHNYFTMDPLNLLTFVVYFAVVLLISLFLVWTVKMTFGARSRYVIGS